MSKFTDDVIDKYAEAKRTRTIASWLGGLVWLAGMVLAKGFWPMFFAIWTPYGGYLVVEKALQLAKVI